MKLLIRLGLPYRLVRDISVPKAMMTRANQQAARTRNHVANSFHFPSGRQPWSNQLSCYCSLPCSGSCGGCSDGRLLSFNCNNGGCPFGGFRSHPLGGFRAHLADFLVVVVVIAGCRRGGGGCSRCCGVCWCCGGCCRVSPWRWRL